MTMSKQQQAGATIVGLALIGIYSWIMVATSGSAPWAWVILLLAVVVLVATVRAAAAERGGRDS